MGIHAQTNGEVNLSKKTTVEDLAKVGIRINPDYAMAPTPYLEVEHTLNGKKSFEQTGFCLGRKPNGDIDLSVIYPEEMDGNYYGFEEFARALKKLSKNGLVFGVSIWVEYGDGDFDGFRYSKRGGWRRLSRVEKAVRW